MPLHKDLTGADLHEPKGVAGASANTSYIANGSGSGTWKKVDANAIDTTSVKNVNKSKKLFNCTNVNTARSWFIPFTDAATLVKAQGIISGPIASNITITLKNNGSTTIGTFTLTAAGSAAGQTFVLTPSANNIIAANTFLQIDTSGGGATAADFVLLFDITL